MMPRFCLALVTAKSVSGEKRKLPNIWSFVLLASVLLSGCDKSSPRLDRLFSLRIQTTDLPDGWYREKGGIGDRDSESEGIISRWVQFRGVPEAELPGVLVIHELIDYPDLDQATTAYGEIVEEAFPVEEWIWPEQIQLYRGADQFYLACLDIQAAYEDADERYWGMYHCTAVGRYGSTISLLYVSVFQDQWLTFEDLQRLLEAADARIADQP